MIILTSAFFSFALWPRVMKPFLSSFFRSPLLLLFDLTALMGGEWDVGKRETTPRGKPLTPKGKPTSAQSRCVDNLAWGSCWSLAISEAFRLLGLGEFSGVFNISLKPVKEENKSQLNHFFKWIILLLLLGFLIYAVHLHF